LFLASGFRLAGTISADAWNANGSSDQSQTTEGGAMLVLSRKSREAVVVGGVDGFHRLLKVTVLGIHGMNVRLGFEVDSSVPVHRLEVWERINTGTLAERPDLLRRDQE
jgi:carbon storage regulator CsrA